MNTPERDHGVDLIEPPAFDDRGFARVGGRDYLELTENGWGALIAAAAGPDRLRRTPSHRADYTSRTVHERAGQAWTVREPRTAEDQQDIDDAIDEHLTEAGLGPRQRGFRWLLLAPPSINDSSEFWRDLNRRFAVLTSSAPDPAESFAAIQEIMHAMYGEGDSAT